MAKSKTVSLGLSGAVGTSNSGAVGTSNSGAAGKKKTSGSVAKNRVVKKAGSRRKSRKVQVGGQVKRKSKGAAKGKKRKSKKSLRGLKRKMSLGSRALVGRNMRGGMLPDREEPNYYKTIFQKHVDKAVLMKLELSDGIQKTFYRPDDGAECYSDKSTIRIFTIVDEETKEKLCYLETFNKYKRTTTGGKMCSNNGYAKMPHVWTFGYFNPVKLDNGNESIESCFHCRYPNHTKSPCGKCNKNYYMDNTCLNSDLINGINYQNPTDGNKIRSADNQHLVLDLLILLEVLKLNLYTNEFCHKCCVSRIYRSLKKMIDLKDIAEENLIKGLFERRVDKDTTRLETINEFMKTSLFRNHPGLSDHIDLVNTIHGALLNELGSLIYNGK